MQDWPEPVERVAAYLRERGVDSRLEEFTEAAPTAAGAAEAIGCALEEIVKSLVFVCDGLPYLVLVPGHRRADPAKVAAAAGAGYARSAGRDEVESATGFEPGAVAPFPTPNVTRVFCDRELLRVPTVWAGAGSPRHVVGLAAVDVVRLTNAEITDLTEA
jgi:prolyl-tRNA editing enzyme YbaK/EbsC (Cys-tRNA(Pro) deacylase)